MAISSRKSRQLLKYSGITISNDMSWNKHIDQTSSKANCKLGFLRRNIKTKDQALKEKAYNTIVRPTVEYCSTVWDPYYKTQADTIEKVQRRAARWVTGRFHNTSHASDMLQHLGWRDLNQRRVDSRLCMLYKIRHGLVDIPIGHFFKFQRNGVNFQTIYARTKYYEFSFFPWTVTAWNELPSDTISAQNLDMFKQNIVNIHHVFPTKHCRWHSLLFFTLLIFYLYLYFLLFSLTHLVLVLYSNPAHSL